MDSVSICVCLFFFFNDTATTEIYTLSLHDALPLSRPGMISTIRRVDPDQVAAQARDFVLRGRGRGGWVLRHPPIVAFALPPGGVALFCSMGSVLMSGRAGC